MARVRGQVVLGLVFGWSGCVQLPTLDGELADAGSAGFAALGHRVDAALAPWQPVLPGCGAGSSGSGVGPGDRDPSDSGDGLDAGTDFGARPPGSPPQPVLPGPAAAGAVLITEIMANPEALSDSQGEWFELLNPGSEPLELAACAIGDGGDAARPIGGSFVIGPGQYRVLARSAAAGFVPDLISVFSLSNDSDTLSLSCAGQLIDAVAYSASQGFALKGGASLSLDPSLLDAVANDLGTAWCEAVDPYGVDRGTPGRANPACPVPA